MKKNAKTRLVVLIVLVVILASSNALLLMQSANRKKDFEGFLIAREAITSLLKEKFAKPPEGTAFCVNPGGTTTLSFPGRGAALNLYPTSDHVRNMVTNQWQHCWNFTAVLANQNLPEAAKEKDSNLAWRADKISDWLLSDLAKAGFCLGLSTTKGTQGSTQLAQQYWWTDNFTIYVISETLIDFEAKTARLSLTIIESF